MTAYEFHFETCKRIAGRPGGIKIIQMVYRRNWQPKSEKHALMIPARQSRLDN